MTSLQKIKNHPYLLKALIAAAAIGVGFIISAPFFMTRGERGFDGQMIRQIPSTHDLVQHLAVMQDFDKVLRHGNLYPRWLPDVNNGYGLPWMNYYPPGFYYVTSLLHTLDANWINTLFMVSVLGFAASGLAFYLVARLFYSRLASALAGILYMALPFHVTELYWRGAMPQFMGYVLLPLVLYFGYKTGAIGKAGHYAGLALCYGLYLMTHAPTALLMSYAMAFYGIVWAFRQRDWKIVVRIGLAMAVGLLLAAIYLVPAALETNDMQEHFSGLFPYHSSYLTFIGGDGFGQVVNLSFICQALVIIAGIVILRLAPASGSSESSESGAGEQPAEVLQTRMWVLLGVTTMFMCTSLSIYVSKLLPKIQVATFAWRWLAVASLFTALLAAAAIDRLRQRADLAALKAWGFRALLGAAMLAAVLYTAIQVIPSTLSHMTHMQPYTYLEAGFTPKGSTHPQSLPTTSEVTLTPEAGAADVVRWDPGRREVLLTVNEPVTARLKTYNFPGWSARLDGQSVPLLSDSDGVQVVEVPAGTHRLEVSFHNTATRRKATLMTGFAFLIIAGLAFVTAFQYIKGSSASREDGLEVTEKERRAERTKRLVVVGLPLVAVLVIVVVAVSLLRTNNEPAVSNTPAASSPPVSDKRLHVPGLSQIMVAVDAGALDELMNTLPTGDAQKIEGLVETGKVFRVAGDTMIDVLERSSARMKIKILDGAHRDQEGWVPERWVQ